MAKTKTEVEVLGTARLVGRYESGSPEWLAARSNGNSIGGSEVGTIVGCNPWESPYTLWAKRTGRIESSIAQTDAMEWGTRLEDAILGRFIDDHPELEVLGSPGTYAHQDREWQVANPDAVYTRADGTKGIVEVKTAQYEDAWSEGVPAYYRTQVQWYMQTFGFDHAYVVVLVRGNRYKEYEVQADQFEQDTNLEQVVAFREFLINHETEPEFSAPYISTYETTRTMHPEIDPDLEVELGPLAVDYLAAVAIKDAAEEKLNETKSAVQVAMGNAKKGLLGGEWTITRQARNGGSPYLVTKKG